MDSSSPFPSPQPPPATPRESALLLAIFQATVECIITIDDKGVIESANPAVTRHFGYRPEELVGQKVNILMPSPDREQHDQYLENYHRTHQPKIIGIGREVTGQRRDGTTFPAYLAVSEMYLNGQRKYVGVIHDISDRKRYELSLRQRAGELRDAKEHLESANRAKDRFLAVLSHELRTPLTPALAMLSLLESDLEPQSPLRETLRTIRRNIELEARLIDDLLDLTRITRGKLKLNTQTTDIHSAIRETVDICAPELKQSNHRLDLQLDAPRHAVRADPARLRQVLWNVLKNAIKFTPPGGSIRIRTSPEHLSLPPQDGPDPPPAPAVGIDISDTGIGIEPAALSRIFNAFEQEGETVSHQFGGLGLGLAITRALVLMHGGEITAHSEGRGTGAKFSIRWPLAHDAEAGKPQTHHDNAQTTGTGGPAMRILLVDDHPDTLRAIRLLLTRQGHDVNTAGSVAEAISRLDQEFDLLISDIGLPDGNGLEIMRQATARWPGIRGIALSGYGMEDDLQRSYAAGFHEHLTKPIDLPTLRDAVHRVLAGRSTQESERT